MLLEPLRLAIQKATDAVFSGRSTLTTASGEVIAADEVRRANQLAEEPLGRSLRQLRAVGRSETAMLIERLYPALIPHFIANGAKNPVHHTAYVLEFMATILIGENRADRPPVAIGMMAALFHDVALGLTTLPKITEANIQDKARDMAAGRCSRQDLAECLRAATEMRREHMRLGGQIARSMLTEHGLNGFELSETCRIVEHHDDVKIPMLFLAVRAVMDWDDAGDQAGLISREDWLLQMHHEADLLWMVTPAGIEADLQRLPRGATRTRSDMLAHNVDVHRQEVDLYRGLADFDRYGFRDNTPYRTATGAALFRRLVGDPSHGPP